MKTISTPLCLLLNVTKRTVAIMKQIITKVWLESEDTTPDELGKKGSIFPEGTASERAMRLKRKRHTIAYQLLRALYLLFAPQGLLSPP